jgi:hypothetical protein
MNRLYARSPAPPQAHNAPAANPHLAADSASVLTHWGQYGRLVMGGRLVILVDRCLIAAAAAPKGR